MVRSKLFSGILSLVVIPQIALADTPRLDALRYGIVDLGPKVTDSSATLVINDYGHVAFPVTDSRGALILDARDSSGAPIFSTSQMLSRTIGLAPGTINNRPNSINNQDIVVGESANAVGSKAYLYDEAGMQVIPSTIPPAASGYHRNMAMGVNDTGSLVGVFSGAHPNVSTEVFYSFATGLTGIVVPFGSDSGLIDINNIGNAIGYAAPPFSPGYNSSRSIQAGMNGLGWDQTPIAPPVGASRYYPLRLNDFAKVVGTTRVNPTTVSGPHVLDLPTLTYTLVSPISGAPSGIATANDINNWGIVAGTSRYPGSTEYGDTHAMLARGDATKDLNALSNAAALGLTLTSAHAINNRGDVVGVAVTGNQQYRYFLALALNSFSCAADLDGDGLVNSRDIDLIRRLQGVETFVGDLNHDRVVTADDVKLAKIAASNHGICPSLSTSRR